MSNNKLNFWQHKPLEQLNKSEWESLCDGCGRCCLHKLETPDNVIHFTNVVCRYLDEQTCACTDYNNRQNLVSHCLSIKPNWAEKFNWLPNTCAYRLLSENKPLPEWHPLVSGDKNTVHYAGISIRGRAYSDKNIKEKEYPKYIIDWI